MVKTKRDRALVKRIRQLANFETASFGDGVQRTVRIQVLRGDKWTDVTVTEFIRERTRLYRDTWLNPLFDELEGGRRAYDGIVDAMASNMPTRERK